MNFKIVFDLCNWVLADKDAYMKIKLLYCAACSNGVSGR